MLFIMTVQEPHNLGLNAEVHALLLQLQELLSGSPDGPWLVGGTIRDLLEGDAPQDFDLAFAVDMTPQIKRWANRLGGTWFWLDQKRNQSRVLFGNRSLQFDFAPLRADTLIADLELRDFTVNAMALSLPALIAGRMELIDPLGGSQDLEQGVLRSCGPNVLNHDPLRLLKGVRHYAQHGWSFEKQTALQMSTAAHRLMTVAGERIRNELGQILASDRVVAALELMAQLQILEYLFPGANDHHFRAQLESRIERLDQLALLPAYESLLGQQVEEGLTLRSLLILAALLQVLEPRDGAGEVARRLRCSTRSQSILKTLCRAEPNLAMLKDSDRPRIAALKLEALGADCCEQILYALLLQRNIKYDRCAAEAIGAYHENLKMGRIVDLLDGSKVMSLTGMSAGKKVGVWQDKIKAAEIAGKITDKLSAEDWLRIQFSD